MQFDEIRCGDGLKEPMYPNFGERPEFMPRTPEEVMRTYASGLDLVGNERKKGGHQQSNHCPLLRLGEDTDMVGLLILLVFYLTNSTIMIMKTCKSQEHSHSLSSERFCA